jgi:hypothetical protein
MTRLQTLKAITALLLLSNLIPFISYCQNKTLNCTDLHNGIFHCYPKNLNQPYLIRRDGEFQYEYDITDNDTARWQVKWTNDCTYTMKFVEGRSKNFTDETVAYLNKHNIVIQITNVTNEYYIYNSYIDKASNLPLQTDTIWLSEKTNVTNNEVYKRIIDNSYLRKHHFSDTSKYAVLYIYRPKKLSNSLGNYPIYFNDNIMCIAENNSGYIFIILKEGQYKLSSRLFKDESSTSIDVKFGKTYYVKSMIHWGITSRLYNFRLEMATVSSEIGESEFSDVDL